MAIYARAFIVSFAVVTFAVLTQNAQCGQSIDSKSNPSEPKSVVVFATRAISKGTVIVDADLRESVINSRGFRESDIPGRNSITGRRSRYAMTKGQIILERDLLPSHAKPKNAEQSKHSANFVQAKRAIRAGSIIARSDLTEGSVKTTDSSTWVRNENQVVGMQAKFDIVAGQLLTTDVLIAKSAPFKAR
ncbi:MAG: hypothetical protein EKK48_10230 [Candidatus Melainabacteria bacterium]|nr:MAG: hypothetical protein EKK48_10230 [Candidatus Melainabacteria bacterium]